MIRHIPPVKKRNTSIYLILLFLTIVAMISLKECSGKQLPLKTERVAGGDTLNIAIEISPMGVTMVGDSLGGVYYNMLSKATRKHGIPVLFHPFTLLSTAMTGLNDGRYQLVVSDIPITAELKEKYLFVDPILIDRQVLVQRRDSITGEVEIKSQLELGGKQIAVPAGSPFISRLHNLSKEIGDTIYIEEDSEYSSEQLVILTALGELQRVVVSEHVARLLLKRYPILDASVAISFNQFHGWLLAPTDTILRDSISSWIYHAH